MNTIGLSFFKSFRNQERQNYEQNDEYNYTSRRVRSFTGETDMLS